PDRTIAGSAPASSRRRTPARAGRETRASGPARPAGVPLQSASSLRSCSSPCRSTAGIALLFRLAWLFRLDLLQVDVQAIETLLPQAPVVLDPLRGGIQGLRLEPRRAPLAFAAAHDEPGALQHLEVLGDRRQAHVERL